jgi:hypothetical protein
MHRSLAIVIRPRQLVLAASLAWGVGCATEPADPGASTGENAAQAEVNANAEAKAKLTVAPTLGGSVFAVGEYQTELAIFEDGWVKGLVFDARGQAVPPALVTSFMLSLSAQGDAKPRATLLWDVDCKCFQGKADVAASLVAKPIEVSFDVDGKAQAGVLAAYTLLPKLNLNAQADLNGEATAEVPTPNVKAKLAAGAQASNDAKANLSATAKAGAGATAKAAVAVPKPVVHVEVQKSASTSTKPNAAVKAKASAGFSFGSK